MSELSEFLRAKKGNPKLDSLKPYNPYIKMDITIDTLANTWHSFEDLTAQYVGYAWRQQNDQTERFDWVNMPMSGLQWPLLGAMGYLVGMMYAHSY